MTGATDELGAEVLSELARLEKAATPGLWAVNRTDPAEGWNGWRLEGPSGVSLGDLPGGYRGGQHEPNAALIAAARNALPALIAAARREADARDTIADLTRQLAEARTQLAAERTLSTTVEQIAAQDAAEAALAEANARAHKADQDLARLTLNAGARLAEAERTIAEARRS